MYALIRQQKSIIKIGCNAPIGFSNKYIQVPRPSNIRRQLYGQLNAKRLDHSLRPSIIAAKQLDYYNSPGPSRYTYNPFPSQRRPISFSSSLLEQSSSKVEVTVNAIKKKEEEKKEELKREAQSNVVEIPKPVPVKKSLQQKIWDEVLHFYHGFRLLFIDINISRKLLGRVLQGKTLSRRENRLLIQTTSDLFRLIPFSIFIIVPFMELLLPFFIKFFPNMLPSTFQTAKERENRLKQSLQVRLEVAKFLQKTLDEMAVQHAGGHTSEEAKAFANFFKKIKDPNEHVSAEEIIKFSKQFEDEITLDSLSRNQLVALCRVLELNTVGTTNFLRFQLRVKLRSLAADDRVIAREGVKSLNLFELQQACKTRGMRAYGLSEEKLRSQLQEWIDLSMNEKVPNTLLLLSRALMISDEASTSHKLKETIRVLPDVVGTQTKAAIGEREGKIDHKTKIEVIKEEERKIKEEREEEKELEKAKTEKLLDKAPAQVTSSLHPELDKHMEDASISPKDVELLGQALKSVIGDKQQLIVEMEHIRDLKEEIADYKEDVEELKEITTDESKKKIRESRGAKILFKKVNKMISNLDTVLQELEQQKNKSISTKSEKPDEICECTDISDQPAAQSASTTEHMVRIDDLVKAIKMMQKASDDTKLKTIEKVLSKIDVDRDGSISANEVLKVVETIVKENVNLSEKQVEELLELLDKEQLIEAEVKVEKAIQKSIKEADNVLKVAEEIQDLAPNLLDKATDLSAEDEKNILVDKLTSADTKAKETAEIHTAAVEKVKEKVLPKSSDISSSIPPTIPPPPPTPQGTPKDKML